MMGWATFPSLLRATVVVGEVFVWVQQIQIRCHP